MAKFKQEWIAFAADASTIDRLKKAGASDTLVDAVRSVPNPSQNATQAGRQAAITYQYVLKLLEFGLDEPTILKRLNASPTHFTLGAAEVAELKKANASEAVLAAMRGASKPGRGGSPRLTDFAIVLDCSGSMGEMTTVGQSRKRKALPSGGRLPRAERSSW